MSNKQFYVNNRKLYNALKEHRKYLEMGDDPDISNYIGDCIMKICERISHRGNFIGYTFKDEMVGDAIENCIAAVNNFNPEKTENPFGYFTQIAMNAFLRRIQKEKKQAYIKAKNYDNLAADIEICSDASDRGLVKRSGHPGANELIQSFEKKIGVKKDGDNKPLQIS